MSEIDRYLAALSEPRRTRIEHLLDVIETAEPGLPRALWSYGDGVIGFGHYHYRYASGREGNFFMVGVASRKRYVSIYTNCADGGKYLTESFRDRFPGCKIGKSCIEVPDSVTIDDEVLADLTRQTVAYFQAEMQKPKIPKTMQIWG
ncbi:MAG: DUF1801 domain-containing protein [Thermomicrobiales bacterium]|nr:DUF1801 domain-containing protein [Thermomicrobiales bacterium]